MKKKTSAKKSEILSNLNDKTIEKSKSIKVVVQNYEEGIINEPLLFKVGENQVTIFLKKEDDLYVSCTCQSWIFQGSEYHAKKNNYLYGDLQGNGQEPTKRDPQRRNKICKHIYAVLRDFF